MQGPISLLQCYTVSLEGNSGLLPWLLTHTLPGPGMETSNPGSQSSALCLHPKPRFRPRPSSTHCTREHVLPRRQSRATVLPC